MKVLFATCGAGRRTLRGFTRCYHAARIMRDSFFVGVHPFLALEVMDYIAEQLVEAVK